MAELENDELARAKRLWRKNGSAIVIGVLVVVLCVAGWYGWDWYRARQNDQAAQMYSQVVNGIGQDNVTGGVVNLVNTLQNAYESTPYAGAAAMALAAYYVHQNQLDKAASHLDWAMANAKGEGMRAIATVREARVRWAQNKPDAALKLLDRDHPAAFDSLYAELAGDIHLDQGNRQAAHAAYQKALAHLPQNIPRQPLTEKLQASAPANAATPGTLNSATNDSSNSS